MDSATCLAQMSSSDPGDLKTAAACIAEDEACIEAAKDDDLLECLPEWDPLEQCLFAEEGHVEDVLHPFPPHEEAAASLAILGYVYTCITSPPPSERSLPQPFIPSLFHFPSLAENYFYTHLLLPQLPPASDPSSAALRPSASLPL